MSELEVTEVSTEEVLTEITTDPLTELQEELDQIKDQFLRAKAETENVRRRGVEETDKARKYAIEKFAESLFAVADSLYAALEVEETDGLKLTIQQLTTAFEQHKIVEVNPEVGSKFDPHAHQAISKVESDQPENTIVKVLQRGYTLSGRVVRPAMVTVSQGGTNVG